jgi:hypothetical protein
MWLTVTMKQKQAWMNKRPAWKMCYGKQLKRWKMKIMDLAYMKIWSWMKKGVDLALSGNYWTLVWILLYLASTVSLQDIAKLIFCAKLDNQPKIIQDKFRTTQGDGYHSMAPPKFLLCILWKKLFVLPWWKHDFLGKKEMFAKIIDKLKLDGMSDKDFESIYLQHCNFPCFLPTNSSTASWKGTSDTEATHCQLRVEYRNWTIWVELVSYC